MDNTKDDPKAKRETDWQRYQDIKSNNADKIGQQEKEKAFLLDKTIGKGQVLRPSDSFIEKTLGKQKTDQEILKEVDSKSREQYGRERATKAQATATKESNAKREQTIQKPDRAERREKVKEKLRQQRQQTHGRKRVR